MSKMRVRDTRWSRGDIGPLQESKLAHVLMELDMLGHAQRSPCGRFVTYNLNLGGNAAVTCPEADEAYTAIGAAAGWALTRANASALTRRATDEVARVKLLLPAEASYEPRRATADEAQPERCGEAFVCYVCKDETSENHATWTCFEHAGFTPEGPLCEGCAHDLRDGLDCPTFDPLARANGED